MEDKKPKTHKGKLYLESLLPKLIEGPKQCVFINTANIISVFIITTHF